MTRAVPEHLQSEDVAYCGKCKQWKPKQAFHKDSGRASGIAGHCKACKAEWRAANAQHLIQKAMEWQRNNPERARQHIRKWQTSNLDKVRAHRQAADKKNIEKRNSDPILLEKRREQNRRAARKRRPTPEDERIRRHKRRARKNDNGGSFTRDEWVILCAQYENRCLCCGESKPLTMDHVIALSSGGSNSITNIQPLCHECNSKKGTKTIDYRPSSIH